MVLTMVFLLCIFSICGYSNVYSMDKFDDNHIGEIEKVVREDFSEMLQCEQENVLQFIDNHDIFGLYKANHQRFRFLPGEKNLILQFVEHVKSFKSANNEKLQNDHFIMPENHKLQSKKHLCLTPIGYLFGNKLLTKVANDNEKNSSSESLLLKLNSLLRPFSVTTSAEMIIIKNNGQKVFAEATCILCKDSGKSQQICIQYDVPKNSLKAHWNVSNFSRHLQRHGDGHKLNRKRENNNNGGDNKLLIETHTNPKVLKVETDELEELNVDIRSRTGSNDAMDGDLTFYTRKIYDQISEQNLKLTKSLKKHKPVFNEIVFQLNTQRTVNVVAMQPDGSCLFAALTHQLNLDEANSTKHVNAAKNLRERVVKYINDNFVSFKSYITRRLNPKDSENSGDETEIVEGTDTNCLFFVNSLLSKTATWGGTESLKAISELEKVNILIFPEGGKPYFPFYFNTDYTRTVAIAFCLDEQRKKRNHYDSIAEVNKPILYDTAAELARNQIKKLEIERNPNKVVIVS